MVSFFQNRQTKNIISSLQFCIIKNDSQPQEFSLQIGVKYLLLHLRNGEQKLQYNKGDS